MYQKLNRLLKYLHNTELLWSDHTRSNRENEHIKDYAHNEGMQGRKRNIWY